MSIDNFAHKYNISKGTIHVRRNNGSFPAHIFKSEKNCCTLIDEHYIHRRVEFRKKIIKTIQDIYFKLNENYNDYEISRMLHKVDKNTSVHAWNNFIYRDLFRSRDNNRLILNIYKKEWKFFKYSKLILRELNNANDK